MSNLKHFEVLITAFKTVVVKAEDESHAKEIAINQVSMRDNWSRDEISIEKTLSSEDEVSVALHRTPEKDIYEP